MHLTEHEVLATLDNCHDGYYSTFVNLGDPYSYLIDSRINVFRSDAGKWAIAIERLGDNPRAGGIALQIFYFGNCLINLEQYNNHPVNYSNRLVRESAGSDEIRASARKDRGQIRATDDELYKSIPRDLQKFLVIDEWFHRDFVLLSAPPLSDEQLRQTYEFNKKLTGNFPLTFEQFRDQFRHQMLMQDANNREQWEHNRPGSYETWQLIAKAIVSGNPDDYKPTLSPNSHWSHWPESGSL